MKQPLKIGIVVNKKCELPVWEFIMLQQIQESSYLTIAAIFISDNQPPAKTSFLYRLFTKFENWWFGASFDACKKISIETKFNDILFPLSETALFKQLNPDIIIISSLADTRSLPALHATYGKWKIVFGKGIYKSAMPPAFWEVMRRDPVTGSSLTVQLPGSNEEIIVYDGSTVTIPFSVKNNLNNLAWKSSSFILYRLKELYELGADFFFDKYRKRSMREIIPEIQPLKAPGNILMAGLFLKNCFSYFIYKFNEWFNKKRFTILISDQVYNGNATDFSVFKKLQLPPNSFRADPFLIKKDNRQFIFFEEYLYSKKKAHISVIELLQNGNSSEATVVLDKPYHLSYPFVFEWEGYDYMVLETAANKTVELYKCKQFPQQWEFVMNLMEDISLIDVTLHFENERWWLFACTQNHSFTTSNDQLLLFYSDNLFSDKWITHPQNPVATDISNCRPAGKIFSKDGKLYRPAQNNASQQYGYALKINCIEILNEMEYKETEVFEVLPGVGNKLSAVHTINFTDDTIVIDGICKP